MYISIPKDGRHLKADGIAHVEQTKEARYLGAWAIKTKTGWTEMPVDVFYVANPDRSQGHSNYFGMFVTPLEEYGEALMICDAASAFSQVLNAVLTDDGEVLISRYRHDYRDDGEVMIDGGRDYCRHQGDLHEVTVNDGTFFLDGEPVSIMS